MLWSEKVFNSIYDYLHSLRDRRLSTEKVNTDLNERIIKMDPDAKFKCTVISTYGKFDPELAVWNLLSKNPAHSRKLLCENFCMAIVCAFPLDEDTDRILLLLANKQD